jgi:hypothetical protein
MEYTVNAMILKGYTLSIEARTEEDALEKVRQMTSEEVASQGSLQYADVDYVEIKE